MARSVRETDTVRRALGLGPVHLLGQSFGGFVALEYVLAHPEHVLSLVLSNTAASAAETVRHMHGLRTRSRRSATDPGPHEAAGTTDSAAYQDVVRRALRAASRRSHPYEPERSGGSTTRRWRRCWPTSAPRTCRCGAPTSSCAPGR